MKKNCNSKVWYIIFKYQILLWCKHFWHRYASSVLLLYFIKVSAYRKMLEFSPPWYVFKCLYNMNNITVLCICKQCWNKMVYIHKPLHTDITQLWGALDCEYVCHVLVYKKTSSQLKIRLCFLREWVFTNVYTFTVLYVYY